MDWKKPLITVSIIGILIFTIVGCNSAGNGAEVSTISTSTQQTNTGNNEDNNNPAGGPGLSDNRTMPVPPGGEFRQGAIIPEIDWAAAAAALGVTEDALKQALGDISAGMPDFAAVAAKLGVTEQQLMEALGFKGGNILPGGERPQGQPPQGGGVPPQSGQIQGGTNTEN